MLCSIKYFPMNLLELPRAHSLSPSNELGQWIHVRCQIMDLLTFAIAPRHWGARLTYFRMRWNVKQIPRLFSISGLSKLCEKGYTVFIYDVFIVFISNIAINHICDLGKINQVLKINKYLTITYTIWQTLVIRSVFINKVFKQKCIALNWKK